MDSDPILQEVHKTKDELARQAGWDLAEFFRRLREAANQRRNKKEHAERDGEPRAKTPTTGN